MSPVDDLESFDIDEETTGCPRIYVDAPLTVGEALELPEGASAHLSRVLRLRVGEPVIVFNGQGGQYQARVVAVAKRHVTVQVERYQAVDNESPLYIHLGQGVSRGDRMDWAIQKAVELGVARITPLLTERSTLRLNEARWENKLRHWQQIIIHACEQSGRQRIPILDKPVAFSDWQPETDFKYVLDPSAEQDFVSALMTLRTQQQKQLRIAVAIGPEGGFRCREIRGLQGMHLGARVLRTETAAVVALAVLETLFGDLGKNHH